MKAKEFVPASKPRNFVAKNQKTAGAGAHKDKKKAEKQGYEKHKNKDIAEDSYNTEKQILTRIRQIMYDRKISGTESNTGELHRLKQQLKGIRNRQGEPATDGVEEGWKSRLAGAALAGATALGSAGSAHGADLSAYDTSYLQQVINGEHPRPMISVDDARAELQARADGKQQKVYPEKRPQSSSGYNIEYLKKAADPERTGRFMISIEKAQELLKQMGQGVSEAYSRPEFEINGWKYDYDIDVEDDNRKIWHIAISPEGKRINIDFSPYERMDRATFNLWLKLGRPNRQSSGSLDREKLEKMAQIKGVAMLDPEMANAGYRD
jgi:hypothetical protein